MKFNIKIKLYDVINTNPMEKIKIPMENIIDYKQGDLFLLDSLYTINKNIHPLNDFKYYVHIYVSHEGIELSNKSFIFPQARTFMSYEDAKKFISDYVEYISNNT